MMRAAYIAEFGANDKVQVGEVPAPEPQHGEVLVRVKASALNHLDIWVRKGRPGLELKQAHVLGSDAAGVIERLGEGVTGMRIGDEVVVNPGVSCMACEFCARGEHSECPSFRLVGFQRQGTHGELVAVPACNLGPRPKGLSWEEAAALPLAHLTAWHMLFARCHYRAGESVLIHGIGGGVALAALQIVTATGGRAIVTSSSTEKLARAKELGAAEGLCYQSADVGAETKRRTGGRGVDIAFDTAGAATLEASFAAVRRGGRIVTCGVTGGREATVNLQMLYWNHVSLLGSTMGSQEDFRQLLRFVDQTNIKPVLDRAYPLDQTREALGRMEEGKQFGKIVLKVG